MNRRRVRAAGWGLICWVLSGLVGLAIAAERPKEWPPLLVLGTYPSELPSEELEKIEPVRRGLESRLAVRGYSVAIDIQIFDSYEEAVVAIVGGKVDFVRMGPVNYVLAKQQKPNLKLLGMETQNGSVFLTGYIVVPHDSPIKALSDLRGRSIAFGAKNSTTGRYFPQSALVEAGIFARDLSNYRYLGRHDKVYRAVGGAGFDAGASNEVTFSKYGMEKGFRIIHVMKSPAHAWAGRADLPDGVSKRLQEALTGLTAKELGGLSRDGIAHTTDSAFDGVRRTMLNAERFTD